PRRAPAWAGGGAPDRCAAANRRSSCDTRYAVGEIAEINGNASQLVRGAFELAQRGRLILRRRRNVLGAGAIPARDLGDAHDAIAQPRELELVIARCDGNPLRALRGFGRRLDDLIERLPRRLGDCFDIGDEGWGALHLGRYAVARVTDA